MNINVIVLFTFLSSFTSFSQKEKMYISTEGGKRCSLLLGKTGYNSYYYSEGKLMDSLVCSGDGLILCRIDKSFFKPSSEDRMTKTIFNKALRKVDRYLKSADSLEDLSFRIKGEEVAVQFFSTAQEKRLKFAIVLL